MNCIPRPIRLSTIPRNTDAADATRSSPSDCLDVQNMKAELEKEIQRSHYFDSVLRLREITLQSDDHFFVVIPDFPQRCKFSFSRFRSVHRFRNLDIFFLVARCKMKLRISSKKKVHSEDLCVRINLLQNINTERGNCYGLYESYHRSRKR